MNAFWCQKLDECMMHVRKNVCFGPLIEAMITKVFMPVYLL